jgi:hypothetical protein
MTFNGMRTATHYTGLICGVPRSDHPKRKIKTKCSNCGITIYRAIKISWKNVCYQCFDRIYSQRKDLQDIKTLQFYPRNYPRYYSF